MMKRYLSWIFFLACFFICQPAFAGKAQGLNEAMMGENITGGFGDFHIESKDSFTAESREVIWFASFKGIIGAPEAKLTAEWITPAKEVFKKERFTTKYGNSRFGWAKLDIIGVDKSALELEGQWTIKVYWDDELIDERNFYLGNRKFSKIAIPEEPAAPAETAATAEGYIRLAKVYFKKNDYANSIDSLLRAQNKEPNSPSAYLILGTVYNSIGKPEDAIFQFTKAQELKADKIAVHRGLAGSYTKMGLRDDAIKEYEAALKIKPDSKEDQDKIEELKRMKDTELEVAAKAIVGETLGGNDSFVKVSADRERVKVGQPMTLTYDLYIARSATYTGFYRELSIEDRMINILRPKPTSEGGGFYDQRPIFGMAYTWDESKKALKVSLILWDSACSGIINIGDYILAIDGIPITGTEKLDEILRTRDLNKKTSFLLLQGDEKIEVKVFPSRSYSDTSLLNRTEYVSFGITTQFRSGAGLIVRHAESVTGISEGDVIKAVDGNPMVSFDEWRGLNISLAEGKKYSFLIDHKGEEKIVRIVATKRKIDITAQYALIGQDVKLSTVVVDRKKFTKATVAMVTLTFDSPGTYEVEPGTINTRAILGGIMRISILKCDPIKIIAVKD